MLSVSLSLVAACANDESDSAMAEIAAGSSQGSTVSGSGGVQALPDLDGFKLVAAQPLAAEREDPEWAAQMEDRILAEISRATSVQMDRVEVECRTTLCGVVIEIPNGADRGIRHTISNHLQDTLGFAKRSGHGFGLADAPDFVAIFLESDR